MNQITHFLLLTFCCIVLLSNDNVIYASSNKSHRQQQQNYQQHKPLSPRLQKFLIHKAKDLNLSENEIKKIKITDEYQSKHNGVTHTYLIQYHQGIEIIDAVANINTNKSGQIISMHQSFVADIDKKVNAIQPALSAVSAVKKACDFVPLKPKEKFKITERFNTANQRCLISDGGIASGDIKARLVYHQPKETKTLRLTWLIEIYEKELQHYWVLRIDAQDGQLLKKNDAVIHCSFAPCIISGGAVHKHIAKPLAGITSVNASLTAFDYNVFPMPVESPQHGSRSIVNSPWLNAPNASPFGWHDTDGQSGAEFDYCRGNNVHAQEDRNANNGIGYSPSSPIYEYDYPLDLSQGPETYEDAAITNLFYWNNIMHDVWYEYGFDEVAGNYQENNYGNGGQGSDYIWADAQDGGGTNNANFLPSVDGDNGRMQMYLWTSSAADYMTVNSPANIVGSYASVEAAFGPGLPDAPANITADLILVNDGTNTPTLGCQAFQNAAEVNNNIALIDRGDCLFVDKVINAQNAGAVAVVVCNNVAGGGPIAMGAGGGGGNGITIPSVMISKEDCDVIKVELENTDVNVTLSNTGAPPAIDGDFDNGIVAHEYGHGISTRLTGGPGTASCLFNQEQMGEGWSDWFGMVLTIEAGDAAGDSRGMGTFAAGQTPNGIGIREAPYSTDFALNDYTYENLCDNNISVPHGVGFIWATMLWDMTWAFIDTYGFDEDFYSGTGGNNMAMQLVMDGMKFQPCSPGFVDGRDAILEADLINNGGINQCLIWEVFANRGLGYGADQGSTDDRCDGIASFDLPPTCLDTLVLIKTVAAKVEIGEDILYTLSYTNNTGLDLSGVSITDTLPEGCTYVAGSASCNATLDNGILSFDIGNLPAGNTGQCTYKLTTPLSPFSNYLFEDDMENGGDSWTVSHNEGNNDWALNSSNPNSGNMAWYAQNISSQSDQYLDLVNPITITDNTNLVFYHAYNTETSWDGGVVEISTTNGINWADLGTYMIQNGYNGSINQNNDSPISERAAFTGNSNGYLETIIDLSAFAGLDVLIRFRLGTDGLEGADGWYVDDVQFLDAVILTNKVAITSNEDKFSYAEASTVLIEGDNILQINKTTSVTETPSNTILTYTIDVLNNTPVNLTNVQVSDTLNSGQTYVEGSSDCNASFDENSSVLLMNIGNMTSGESFTCSFDVLLEPYPFSTSIFSDDMENGEDNWTTSNGTGNQNWVLTTVNSHSGNHVWFANDVAAQTDQYLVIANPTEPLSENTELRFWHYYDTEAEWDGGVVEIAIAGTNSWADIGHLMYENGYNMIINDNPASAISNRPAFSGNSDGYVLTKVDLSTYEGEQVKFRFRFASDEFEGGDGWYIDDVSLSNIVYADNKAWVTSDEGASNLDKVSVVITEGECLDGPEVNAGTNVVICKGEAITLNGSGTGDNMYWSASETLSDTTLLNPVANPTTTTAYTLNAINEDDCSATDGVVVVVEDCSITLNIKAFLQGPYDVNTGQMKAALKEAELIPLNQPYLNEPWNYAGTESFASYDEMPDDMVDWVLLEIRDAGDTSIVEQKAAVLLADGSIIEHNPANTEGIVFDDLAYNTGYFILLRHRNHLAVLTKEPVLLNNTTGIIDFTNIENVAGETVVLISDNTYGLYAGDFNADGVITIIDYNSYLQDASTLNKYNANDANLDKSVTVTDFNLYKPNASVIGVKAVRY